MRFWASLFFVSAIVLTVYDLGGMPGFHVDEAWAALRALEVAETGQFKVRGMTSYAGGLHSGLLALWLQLFGSEPAAVRAFTLAANFVAAALLLILIRRHWGERTALYTGLFLFSACFFPIFGRLATESFALNPLLALSACALLFLPERPRLRTDFFAGLVIGLGLWNHLLFVTVPLSLLGAGLASEGPLRFIRAHRKRIAAVIGGALVVFAPLALPPLLEIRPGHAILIHAIEKVPGRILNVFPLLARAWSGDHLFVHYTGSPAAVALLPILALLLSCGYAGYLAWRGDRKARFALTLLLLLCGTAAYIVPLLSDRYVLLPLWCVPLLLAIGATGLETRFNRRLGVSLLAVALAAYATVRTVRNFHAEFRQTGGIGTRFVSYDFVESSEPYVRTDGLYEALIAEPSLPIRVQYSIMLPLKYYDRDRKLLRWWPEGNVLRNDFRELHYRLDFEGQGEPIAGSEFRILRHRP